MTQEDKYLLLKDLCARLPYGVKLFKVNEPESAFELYSINKESGEIKYYKYRGKSLEIGDMAYLFRTNGIPRFKPYLRPMSSMTEKELDECILQSGIRDVKCPNWHDLPKEEHFKARLNHSINMFLVDSRTIDWLNAHHFDYRGLIEKGLALEAPKEIYKF